MRHDWVFDVLNDLRSYADRHRLVALAAKVDEATAVAHAEIAVAEGRKPPEAAAKPPTGRN